VENPPQYVYEGEAEGRGFNERLPHFRVGKPNSTTTKCVTNVQRKEIFPEVGKGFLFPTLISGIEVVESDFRNHENSG